MPGGGWGGREGERERGWEDEREGRRGGGCCNGYNVSRHTVSVGLEWGFPYALSMLHYMVGMVSSILLQR